MIRSIFIGVLCLLSLAIEAQVVINELDADTPGTDNEEIIELKTNTSFFALDDYVIVFFNGSESGGDSSYLALDLDGFESDVNGVFLMGSNAVSPVPEFILFDNTIQNGADAVAIYEGSSADFPDGTLATMDNLIDALIYDTNDADDEGLMNLLGITIQINEGANGNQSEESIQRMDDGTYVVTTPTPGAPNDGSGIVLNGLSFEVSTEELEEGDTFMITFQTEESVTDDLNFDFSLTNDGFDSTDFIGDTTVTISSGNNTAVVDIEIIDDDDDEGDEVLQISFGEIPDDFNRLNDNLQIRVVDNDFTTAPWGTPLNPTFDQIVSDIPEGYYDPINGLAGEVLIQALQDIIADPDVVRAQTYTDVIEILKEADQSPLNSNQVWLAYTEQQRPKLDFQTQGGSNVGLWNREHTYPRSRGGFDDIEADEIVDGIDIFFQTEADSLRHANSDAHGIRAVDGPENSSRGNQDYGEYSGPDGNLGSWKGDVARGIFFLTIRYNGLEVVNGDPDNSTVGMLGDLDTLLEWHRNDPPDDFEKNRNNIVYTWQFNRNPFIDQPLMVEFIFGDQIGEEWMNNLSIEEQELSEILIYPNPVSDRVFIQNMNQGEAVFYNTLGEKVLETTIEGNNVIDLSTLSSGFYVLRLSQNNAVVTKKIIVK